ncbi:MAG: hypothetical protein ABI759_25250, partial [Candidatus Solibacter sp.]
IQNDLSAANPFNCERQVSAFTRSLRLRHSALSISIWGGTLSARRGFCTGYFAEKDRKTPMS